MDEIAEPHEIFRVSGVERQAVGVRGGGDEQVGKPPSMRPARLRYGGHDLSIAPSRGGIEGKWLEGRLYLLETSLTACALGPGVSEVGPSSQLGEGDRAHSDLFWKGGSNRRIVPVDDNRGVE